MASTTSWPHGARTAISLTFDNMGEAADLNRGLWPPSEAVGSHHSVTEALPKMLALLSKYDIKITYFIESWNLRHYPTVIADDIASLGHEVAWHAWQHEAWSKLSETEECANFERSFGSEGLGGFDGVSQGKRLQYHGFRPPGGIIHGDRTLRLCEEHGLDYLSPAAEKAAIVPVADTSSSLVILPFKWRTVDAYYYMDSFAGLRDLKREPRDPLSADTLANSYCAEIDAAIETGQFLSLLFHPFLTNSPERLQAMEKVVTYLAKKRDEGEIWLARCQDVATWTKKHPNLVATDPEWDHSQWR